MDVNTNKIKELIEPLFEGNHLFLVDLELRGARGSQALNVYADTMEGITLAEITKLTRDINDLLDIHDLIDSKYRLTVSSPGIDRSLQHLWEFKKNIGRNLRVLFEENSEQHEAIGKLVAVNEDHIVLKSKKEETSIPINIISSAKVHLKW